MDTHPSHASALPGSGRCPQRPSRLSLLPAAIAVALAACTLGSCGDDDTERVNNVADLEYVPTMTTVNVATFISDSGYTRYHITAPIWYVFDEARTPRWTFPEGLFLEKYDNLFRQEATLRADSAVYFSQRKLWRLDSNVRMRNVAGDRFLTQQLFWDQNARKVYSDSFIHIERSDRIIEGYGFESNETMTRYTIRRPSGIFPVDENRQPGEKGSPSDSTSQRQAGSPAVAAGQQAGTPVVSAGPQQAGSHVVSTGQHQPEPPSQGPLKIQRAR
ncbi:MAG: LPS export ABC transporter periplasmic protein LptC [Bacteroidales bacterium]|nr:LPS export ABC transporter periplasmic protein LptC [Bacteroidales bacterium]MCD8394863.1 LPS export ABC transporter periplasmic protein LptC [Bacteroidales bacterium]